MIWVAPLSVVVLVVGTLLTVVFLSSSQWTLNADSYEVRVRSSLLRAVMFIDGDRVSEVWRKPGRLVELRALVSDARGEITTFTAVLKPRLGRPLCQVFVDGDWMGGDLLEGTRMEPASWRGDGGVEEHLDNRWSTARRLLMRVQDVVGWDERIRGVVDGLGRRTHERLKEVHQLRREGDQSTQTEARVQQLEAELDELMQSIQMLHMTLTTEQHESALQTLTAAEGLLKRLTPAAPPPAPPLVTRTLMLKMPKMKPPKLGQHSGEPRVARRAAVARQRGGGEELRGLKVPGRAPNLTDVKPPMLTLAVPLAVGVDADDAEGDT